MLKSNLSVVTKKSVNALMKDIRSRLEEEAFGTLFRNQGETIPIGRPSLSSPGTTIAALVSNRGAEVLMTSSEGNGYLKHISEVSVYDLIVIVNSLAEGLSHE